MNYLKHYCNLIRKAENRIPPEGYTEKHHTFPISIFGKNKRIVVLTAREHYVAHALLEKAFIKRYGIKHWKTIKMTFAHTCMKLDKNKVRKYYNSILYESARKRFSDIQKNKIFSENTRRKISESKKGNKVWLGKKHNEEAKRKVSEARKGKPLSPEHIQKLKDSHSKITYEIFSPTGEKFLTKNLLDFCRRNNLTDYCMRNTINGRNGTKQHKGGWYARKINSEIEK